MNVIPPVNLELVETDLLIRELLRRSESIVIARLTADGHIWSHYHGGSCQILGLLTLARHDYLRHLPTRRTQT